MVRDGILPLAEPVGLASGVRHCRCFSVTLACWRRPPRLRRRLRFMTYTISCCALQKTVSH